jgi:hypothetical protein
MENRTSLLQAGLTVAAVPELTRWAIAPRMRTVALLILSAVLLFGCSRQVDFVYFNLSGQEIRVTDISGLPGFATPGVLVPSSDDTNRLNEKSATSFEAVRIADQITIRWTETNKKQELQLQREGLGVPAKLSGGRLCFTYLGDGKWRVKLR